MKKSKSSIIRFLYASSEQSADVYWLEIVDGRIEDVVGIAVCDWSSMR
ncbi:MAG: hypothetical protein ABF322_04675 [Lentimonas sp.]